MEVVQSILKLNNLFTDNMVLLRRCWAEWD
mgnify:CR=1 FL=1|jgi:hypothetical protein